MFILNQPLLFSMEEHEVIKLDPEALTLLESMKIIPEELLSSVINRLIIQSFKTKIYRSLYTKEKLEEDVTGLSCDDFRKWVKCCVEKEDAMIAVNNKKNEIIFLSRNNMETHWAEMENGIKINMFKMALYIESWESIPPSLLPYFQTAKETSGNLVIIRYIEQKEEAAILCVENIRNEVAVYELDLINYICKEPTDQLPSRDMYLMGDCLFIDNGDGSYGYIEGNIEDLDEEVKEI